MMLADATTVIAPGISTGEIWMLVLTAIMAVSSMAGTFFRKTDVNVQQPLIVELSKRFVEHTEFAQFRRQTNEQIAGLQEIVRKEIPEMERRIADGGEERVSKLHERMNQILKEVSHLEGVVTEGNKHRS
jgi:hypothetical protein